MASALKIRNLVHKAKPAQGYSQGQHDVSEFIEVLEDEFVSSFNGFKIQCTITRVLVKSGTLLKRLRKKLKLP